MAKNTYELTYIVNAVLSDDQIRGVVNRVRKLIEENGGEITASDEWGSRRLSFPINKKRNGYYVNLFLTINGDNIARIERALEIDDDILRYLTLRMDAKMIRHWEQQKAGVAAAKLADEKAAAKAAAEEEEVEEEEVEEEEEEQEEEEV